MCGRFALKTPPSELATRFGLDEVVELAPRYNIAPGTDIPTIRHSPDGKRVMHMLRWGLVPHWAKDPSIGAKLSNARGETLTEKPSFRDAFKRRRCLVPADGFYEWKTEGRQKQPYYFSMKSGEPFALGGLWESWRMPDGNVLRTCCLITTGPNDIMLPVHDRMPVIVAPDDYETWLTGEPDDVQGLVRPYPTDEMQVWAVSKRVSRSVEEGAELALSDGDQHFV
ncbi:SOS response-associated peptidase [Thiobacillus sp.]|jgi:putative SOS response-associated peptidase YedK|uniref:SOS response-associated peptidase n=1 Tax=Thiobacillus sp. TaxID=924 RepID=UPI0025E859D1|nr:SOS response-associated peptidase [Thiobacillus sp.]